MAKKIIGERSLRALTQLIQTDVAEQGNALDTRISNIEGKLATIDPDADGVVAKADKATDSDTVGGYTLDSFIQSNPNLLDNPDFKINQRGKTEYTGYGYTVDRWLANTHVEYLNSTIAVNDDGLTITIDKIMTQHNYWCLMQRLEGLKEGTYTLSCYVEEMSKPEAFELAVWGGGQIPCVTGVISFILNYSPINSVQAPYFGIISAAGNDKSPSVGDYIKIKWVKLELGSVATPFVPPNPATELTKCMRYYQVINWAATKITGYDNNAGCFFVEHTLVPMRATPTVILPIFDETTVLVNNGPITGTTGWVDGGFTRAWSNCEFQINLSNLDTSIYSDKLIFFSREHPIILNAEL